MTAPIVSWTACLNRLFPGRRRSYRSRRAGELPASSWSCGHRYRFAGPRGSNTRLVGAQGGGQLGCEAVEVECSRVAPSVDEERRRARDVARIGAADIAGDPFGVSVLAEIGEEPVKVQSECERGAVDRVERDLLGLA